MSRKRVLWLVALVACGGSKSEPTPDGPITNPGVDAPPTLAVDQIDLLFDTTDSIHAYNLTSKVDVRLADGEVVAWSPDRTWFVGIANDTLFAFDLVTKTNTALAGLSFSEIVFTDDSKYVLLQNQLSEPVAVSRDGAMNVITDPGHSNGFVVASVVGNGLAVITNGSAVWSCSGDGQTCTSVAKSGCKVSPRLTHFVCGGTNTRGLSFFNVSTGAAEGTWAGGSFRGLIWSDDDSHLFSIGPNIGNTADEGWFGTPATGVSFGASDASEAVWAPDFGHLVATQAGQTAGHTDLVVTNHDNSAPHTITAGLGPRVSWNPTSSRFIGADVLAGVDGSSITLQIGNAGLTSANWAADGAHFWIYAPNAQPTICATSSGQCIALGDGQNEKFGAPHWRSNDVAFVSGKHSGVQALYSVSSSGTIGDALIPMVENFILR